MVRFNQTCSKGITSLFENELESPGFEGDLAAALVMLFPERTAYLKGRDITRLSVHFRTPIPFGPDAGSLVDLLFPDLEGDLTAVLERFGPAHIGLHGIGDGKLSGVEKVTVSSGGDYLTAAKRSRGGLVLTALEFKRLSVLAREGRVLDRVILSVFIDPERVYSYYVPADTIIEEIFAERKELGDYLASGTDSHPYDPMTGRMLDIKSDSAGGGSGLVAFTGSGYLLAPTAGGILGFPWFGRKMAMKRGKGSPVREYPCSNCSKCVQSCPSGIEPAYLYHLAKAGEDDEALALGLDRCSRCGICSIVCPSGIGLYDGIVEALERIEAETGGEETG